MEASSKLDDLESLCSDCDYDWAIRIDGELCVIPAGRLAELDDQGKYKDPDTLELHGRSLGHFQETTGGRLGRVPICAALLFPEAKNIQILVEGRWVDFDLEKQRDAYEKSTSVDKKSG